MWDKLYLKLRRGIVRTVGTRHALIYAYVFLVIFPIYLRSQEHNHNHNHDEDANTIPHHKINPYGCDCMEYWTCALSGGSMYSYCGIHAHDVCCFVPENAEPVGILPTPSRSRCGKKGFDSGHEGEADMAEWPWHVSIFILQCNGEILTQYLGIIMNHCNIFTIFTI